MSEPFSAPPPDEDALAAAIRRNVSAALEEDIGPGDLTAGLIPDTAWAEASVITREPAVVCGVRWFEGVFEALDPRVKVDWALAEGEMAEPGQILCRLQGPARALLSGERAALNFLQTLSGTATVTRRHVQRLAGTRTRLLDTRKTLPGLHLAQKYAVRCGGGQNHRMGLYDAILIKENHIAAAGSIGATVARARQIAPGACVEVETENLQEVDEALAAGADIIMFDEFSPAQTLEAVRRARGRAKLEISGSVDEARLAELAALGVDYISVGALTKHLHAIDLSMRISHIRPLTTSARKPNAQDPPPAR